MASNGLNQLLCVVMLFIGARDINGENGFQVHIGFMNTSLSVSECAGHVEVCLFKKMLSPAKHSVVLNTFDDTAKGNQDYKPLTNVVLGFSSLNDTLCFKQYIYDDNITEYNKTFHINMTTKDPAVTLAQHQTNLTVLIVDNDRVTVQFEQEVMTVEEDVKEGKVDLVCVISDGVAGIPIYLDFEENPEKVLVTAEEGLDFVLKRNQSFHFAPGERRLNLTVDIEHDGKWESDEMFSVRITSLDAKFAVFGEKHTTFVKIKDSTDFANGVLLKQKQEEEDEDYENLVLSLLIVAVGLTLILVLLAITLLYNLIRKKVK